MRFLSTTELWATVSAALLVSLSHASPQPQFPRDTLLLERALAWDEAIQKGEALQHQIEGAQNVRQSPYTRYSDLETYNWDRETLREDASSGSLDDILDTLQVDKSKNQYLNLKQSKPVTVNGTAYPAGNGEYQTTFNPESGTLISINNHEPSSNLPLRSWSDVVFLEWQELCNKADVEVGGLKYVIRSQIEDEETVAILRRACNLSQHPDADWSQITTPIEFVRMSNEFSAILGTADGSGLAYLLSRHEAQFGAKLIKRIAVQGQKVRGEWYPMIIQYVE